VSLLSFVSIYSATELFSRSFSKM